MNDQILFFFSALGVFNGFLLACYFLLYAKPKHISNIFLGFLFLVLSVRVGKSVFFYFSSNLANSFIQIGITACFFIGPLIYFYVKSVLRPDSKIRLNWKYHILLLLPPILYVGIVYPYLSNLDLWFNYFMYAVYFEWLTYLLAAGLLVLPLIKKIRNPAEKLIPIEIWILNIYFGNVLIWVAYFSSNYTSYIVGAISFSLLIYLLILTLIFSKKKQAILFKNAFKYSDKKIANAEAKILLNRLNFIMRDEELYKNPNLKLGEIAKQIHISVHQLSQLLNDNSGKSFPNWVNEYRIKEAQKLIESKHNLSLESIGYECGFNSKSTFYSAFKKITATTPAQFKETL